VREREWNLKGVTEKKGVKESRIKRERERERERVSEREWKRVMRKQIIKKLL